MERLAKNAAKHNAATAGTTGAAANNATQHNNNTNINNNNNHANNASSDKAASRMSEIDEQILRTFDIQKRLGKGAYGIVWKALDRNTSQTVAVKKIFDAFRNETDAQRTFREVMFLRSFRNHPNIVRLHSIHRAANHMDIYLSFEFMESDLHNVIKRGNILKDIHKRFVMYQLLNATQYIHSGNVIHRDMKPSNVLIDSKCRCKIADFGLARSIGQQCQQQTTQQQQLLQNVDIADAVCLTDYVATRWYRAPEILVASKRYTMGIDMWSLGCILGEMLLGKPLFPGSCTVNQIELIVGALPGVTDEEVASVGGGFGAALLTQGKLSKASKSSGGDGADKGGREEGSCGVNDMLLGAPDDARDLVNSLLRLDPMKRLTAKQSLGHRYVEKFRNTSPECELSADILPPFRDDVQLTVSDYRAKLYEIMNEKYGYVGRKLNKKDRSQLESALTVTPQPTAASASSHAQTHHSHHHHHRSTSSSNTKNTQQFSQQHQQHNHNHHPQATHSHKSSAATAAASSSAAPPKNGPNHLPAAGSRAAIASVNQHRLTKTSSNYEATAHNHPHHHQQQQHNTTNYMQSYSQAAAESKALTNSTSCLTKSLNFRKSAAINRELLNRLDDVTGHQPHHQLPHNAAVTTSTAQRAAAVVSRLRGVQSQQGHYSQQQSHANQAAARRKSVDVGQQLGHNRAGGFGHMRRQSLDGNIAASVSVPATNVSASTESPSQPHQQQQQQHRIVPSMTKQKLLNVLANNSRMAVDQQQQHQQHKQQQPQHNAHKSRINSALCFRASHGGSANNSNNSSVSSIPGINNGNGHSAAAAGAAASTHFPPAPASTTSAYDVRLRILNEKLSRHNQDVRSRAAGAPNNERYRNASGQMRQQRAVVADEQQQQHQHQQQQAQQTHPDQQQHHPPPPIVHRPVPSHSDSAVLGLHSGSNNINALLAATLPGGGQSRSNFHHLFRTKSSETNEAVAAVGCGPGLLMGSSNGAGKSGEPYRKAPAAYRLQQQQQQQQRVGCFADAVAYGAGGDDGGFRKANNAETYGKASEGIVRATDLYKMRPSELIL